MNSVTIGFLYTLSFASAPFSSSPTLCASGNELIELMLLKSRDHDYLGSLGSASSNCGLTEVSNQESRCRARRRQDAVDWLQRLRKREETCLLFPPCSNYPWSTDRLGPPSGHSGYRAEKEQQGGDPIMHRQCEVHPDFSLLAPLLVPCFSSWPSIDPS